MQYEDQQIYSRPIDQCQNYQTRLTINRFRGVQYLHLRRYYKDIQDQWRPSSQGISLVLGMQNSKQLFSGLVQILSLAQQQQVISQYFSDTIGTID